MSRDRTTLITFGLLAVLVGLAYLNSLEAGFAYDDKTMIEDNTLLTRLEYLPMLLTSDYWAGRRAPSEAVPWRSGLYRPFLSATFSLNYAWGKVNPVGYHLVNVVLHLAVTWLLYLLARQIGMSESASLVGGAIFAVHPLHTEAVTGIVGRAELLMACGMLTALWLAGRGKRWLSLASFTMALLSKEQAVVFPVVLLLYDLCVSYQSRLSNLQPRTSFVGLRAGVVRYGPYLLVLAGYVLLRFSVLGRLGVSPPNFLDNPLAYLDVFTRILNAVKVAGLYLWLFAWPVTMSADYSYNAIPLAESLSEPGVLTALCIWGLLLGIAGWSFVRGDRRISFAVGLLVLTLLPASNLIVPIGTIMGERLFYLPSSGLCLLIALGWERLAVKGTESRLATRWTHMLGSLALATLCAVLIFRTFERNRDWVDTETLMRSALAAYPASAKVHGVLGGLAVMKADWEMARHHLQTAIGLYPEYVNTEININLNLGVLFLKTNQIQDAVRVSERAVMLDPTSSQTLSNLGTAYAVAQRFEESEMAIRDAIMLNPESHEAHNTLSWVLVSRGRYEEALREADQALRLKPDFRDARLNRARALDALGRAEEAQKEFIREGASVTEPGFLGKRRK